MTTLFHRLSRIATAASLLAAAGLAQAAACTGISLGGSSTDDVTLGSLDASSCVISNVNAQSGPNGNTSAFSSSFGSGWSLLGKIDSSFAYEPLQSLSGVNLGIGFLQLSNDSGLWSLSTNKNVTMDLVFAMHAGNRTGSFLFDNVALSSKGSTLGTWDIDWLNNGNRTPGYSNLTVFGRDVSVAAVPEPQTYAMLLAGLGIVALLSRRKSRRD